uniref:Uncharacterized protein n=1 Tax=Arion vulgaris TaxID=1028688 RepID=A0A0B7B4H0_9EUPU
MNGLTGLQRFLLWKADKHLTRLYSECTKIEHVNNSRNEGESTTLPYCKSIKSKGE